MNLSKATEWFHDKAWEVFPFQREAWSAYNEGFSGIVNAPTGSGKTYSLLLPILLLARQRASSHGVKAIWITPIRALSKEILQAAERAIEGMGLDWTVGVRTGDTTTAERNRQKKQMPDLLITTPESLHLLLASKGYPKTFKNLQALVVDEWHELMGSKRAVQVELALARLKTLQTNLRIWGISATIGNMEEAVEVLLGEDAKEDRVKIIKADITKSIEVKSILPDQVETLPWAGHLGIRMLEKVIPVIRESESTLIFTNTRSQAEIWYQRLLDVAPELAGVIAMHHGSISRELRFWVEDALYTGQLKAVVCTSSLDLGVDFRPVEAVIQVGSPKGVARFMQRAGRSGHQPGQVSRIYFVPTHTLELVEASALRQAITEGLIEERIPYIRSFDVLIQFMITLAVSEGFRAGELYREVRRTFSFSSVTEEEWQWCLDFITTGGKSLSGYDEFHKVELEEGLYRVMNRRTAQRHRMSMGTIVSDAMMRVKFQSGGFLGSIEEWFITKLKPGDVFWFAGRNLELIRIKGMDAQVRLSKSKSGKIPSWQGGRMPLSAEMGAMLRRKMNEAFISERHDPELRLIEPLWQLQQERSIIPREDEFLIEKFKSKEGYHVFFYPFEGRLVHEGMATLLAYRIALFKPLTFSIAMNDYGFELLASSPIPIEEALDSDIMTLKDLREDIMQSVNAVEMARRRFRDIASIAGLVFTGYPGQPVKDKHLQSSTQLIFNVFQDYEPDNLLLQQAYEEALDFQLEEGRLRKALERIHTQTIRVVNLERPSPFAFPIMVDRLSRERLSSESMEDRVKKMKMEWED
ncbi:MAG: ligase-associated DNA damage response DEXH box helicase [Owenweeksia sp.]